MHEKKLSLLLSLALVLAGNHFVYAMQAGGFERGDFPDVPGDEDNLSVVFVPMCPNGGAMEPVGLLGLEATQSLQSMDVSSLVPALNDPRNNSVPLIAQKRIIVRAYFDVLPSVGPCWIVGELQATQNGVSLGPEEPSLNGVQLDPVLNGNLQVKRENWRLSINFQVPDSWVIDPTVPLSLTVKAIGAGGLPVACTRCNTPVTVQVKHPTKLRVRLFSFRTKWTDPATGSSHTFSPQDVDIGLVQSWLRRAFPIAFLDVEVLARDFFGGDISNDPAPSVLKDCSDITNKLWDWRNEAVALPEAMDERVRFVGLFIADDGRRIPIGGCTYEVVVPGADKPWNPVAVPTGPQIPSPPWVNPPPWDHDGSFGDWYAGQELAHTFGFQHLGYRDAGVQRGYCDARPDWDEDSVDSNGNPFGGMISGPDQTYVGFDRGYDIQLDGPLPLGAAEAELKRKPLPGNIWHDIRTWCDYTWLSPRVYEGIMNAPSIQMGSPSLPPPLPEGGSNDFMDLEKVIHEVESRLGPRLPFPPVGGDVDPRPLASDVEMAHLLLGTLERENGVIEEARRLNIVKGLKSHRDARIAAIAPCAAEMRTSRDLAGCLKALPENVLTALLIARKGPAPASFRVESGDFLIVNANVNLTQKTGKIQYATRVSRVEKPLVIRETLAFAQLILTDEQGRIVEQTPVPVIVLRHMRHDHGYKYWGEKYKKSSRNQTGLLYAVLPLPKDPKLTPTEVRLFLSKDLDPISSGLVKPFATLKRGPAPPVITSITGTLRPGAIEIGWKANHVNENVTFTIRVSADEGGSWHTFAVGTIRTMLTLSGKQLTELKIDPGLQPAPRLLVKVIANDGFNKDLEMIKPIKPTPKQ